MSFARNAGEHRVEAACEETAARYAGAAAAVKQEPDPRLFDPRK
jgi:hypothetical protein